MHSTNDNHNPHSLMLNSISNQSYDQNNQTRDTLSLERLQSIYHTAKVHVHKDNRKLLEAFISIYFSRLNQGSSAINELDLAGLVLHHFMMFKSYENNQPNIVAFNPLAEEHHFFHKNSIVQLVVFNRPFLVDTILMTLSEAGINVHTMHNLIVEVERDEDDKICSVKEAKSSEGKNISIINVEIEKVDDTKLQEIEELLLNKMSTLDSIFKDWQDMKDKLESVKQEISKKPLPNNKFTNSEVESFLSWILDDNFIFLGFKEYRFTSTEDNEVDLFSVGSSALGVLRPEADMDIQNNVHIGTRDTEEDKPSESYNQLPQNLKQLLLNPSVLLVSKSSHISPVQRPVYMDFIGIHKFDENGKVIGEYRFIGLFTAKAYQNSVEQIPLLREKTKQLLEMSKLPYGGHGYNKLNHIINALPRDDLFQADIGELFNIVMGISQLQNKKSLKLFARVDHYQRFVSCFVYVPNEKFNTELRIRIQKHLQKAFNGVSSEFRTNFNESTHARVHVHVRTISGKVHYRDISKLEKELTELMHDWIDDFEIALKRDIGEQLGNQIMNKYAKVIPAAYCEEFNVRTAVQDLKRLHSLNESEPMLWHLYQSVGDNDKQINLKIYGQNTPANLSSVLPVLENFGVTVVNTQTYEFEDDDSFTAQEHKVAPIQQWIQEYLLISKHKEPLKLKQVRDQFSKGLKQIWHDKVESDKLNELILTTMLSSSDIVILRAFSKYMLQAKAPFSIDYIQQTLVDNKKISIKLVELFHLRMHPNLVVDANNKGETVTRAVAVNMLIKEIHTLLESVNSLDEDRIIRWLLEIINAVIRTNFYQDKEYQSFKFDANKISQLPQPKPKFEIYVYSPRVEGIHLRGGSVARGGLRWSDRKEDFRTEVLGLVKAQMVKNSVIVPVGSKGGFIVKTPRNNMNRDEWLQEGIACYKIFIRGMLDITDNIVNGEIIPPENTFRYDGDDPYLVVAADKGTATFSDIANNLAREYNFWLDDAFASGGSVGYDHKAMGITAKGAWESVKRHFRLEDKDIQAKDDITVVGIGDMSGDVFGNGMLLSRHIKLVCAFNHLHIFIDPTPNTATSYAERERLFALPRSSWADYKQELISKGGGVFSRSDKFIPISAEMKKLFSIQEDRLTPNEFLHKVLKARVDLIWNGGIGTYVKAESESHAEVGDKANDILRVNGNEIQAKVIGEGGNLGCTQKGRIEYAQSGGRIYTDAIDNSAGVNCSDHEVNIKILLGDIITQGDITTKQRNELLESMTDTVSELVLKQNYLQPQSIELSAYEAVARLGEHQRIMQMLESEKRLDRKMELLPSDEEIATRKKAGLSLTNPEISVLLAYVKMWVFDNLVKSSLPDEAYFKEELKKYFPQALNDKYFNQMSQHRLQREIICTYLTNEIVNRLGFEILCQLILNLGAKTPSQAASKLITVVKAYTLTREVFTITRHWDIIEKLDNKVPANVQIELELALRQGVKQAIEWFIANTISSNNTNVDIEKLAIHYRNKIKLTLTSDKDNQTKTEMTKHQNDSLEKYKKQGLDKKVAEAFAQVDIYGYLLKSIK